MMLWVRLYRLWAHTHVRKGIQPNAKSILGSLIMVYRVQNSNPGMGWKFFSFTSRCYVLASSVYILRALELDLMLMVFPEGVRFYGSEVNKKSLQNHFDRNINPNIKALKQAVDEGKDPKNVVLMEGVRSGKGKGQNLWHICFILTLHPSPFVFALFGSAEPLWMFPRNCTMLWQILCSKGS